MLNRPLRNSLVIAAAVFALSSCNTAREVSYFQNIDELLLQNQQLSSPVSYEPIIGVDDRLSITVSALDPNGAAPFNLPAITYLQPGEQQMAVAPSLQTFLVGSDGYIDYPVLGRVKVEGLTKLQLIEQLQGRISEYVKTPLVNIELMNFRVSVLGEVNQPGMISVPNDRITILDAIGMAGDLTIHGERKNVLLIREVNGKREFHRFDLTSSALFASPYYYLRQNDVVYVEPNLPRQKNAKFSQTDQFNLSLVSVVVSAASVIASLMIALLIK